MVPKTRCARCKSALQSSLPSTPSYWPRYPMAPTSLPSWARSNPSLEPHWYVYRGDSMNVSSPTRLKNCVVSAVLFQLAAETMSAFSRLDLSERASIHLYTQESPLYNAMNCVLRARVCPIHIIPHSFSSCFVCFSNMHTCIHIRTVALFCGVSMIILKYASCFLHLPES